MSLVSIYSIIMTFWGVNHLLSGLHSYAAGDPVPIPNYIWIFVGWGRAVRRGPVGATSANLLEARDDEVRSTATAATVSGLCQWYV